MYRNQYGSVIDKSKIKLIAARARRMGFRRQDIEDVQQHIAMVLMEFNYDPEKSNGASETTAITALIDHQLLSLRRSQQRYAKRVTGSENIPSDVPDALYEPVEERRMAIATDLDMAKAQLSPMAREVCESLADGQSLNEIAKRLGVGWHTIERHVESIRGCFEQFGIDAVLS